MWVEDGEDDDLQLISWESVASRPSGRPLPQVSHTTLLLHTVYIEEIVVLLQEPSDVLLLNDASSPHLMLDVHFIYC
jgi:hypothetical protein